MNDYLERILSDASHQKFLDQVAKGNLKSVTRQLDAGTPVDFPCESPPLLTAIANNRAKIALLLLERGADPNNGFCLHQLAQAQKNTERDVPLVHALLDAGAEIDALMAKNTPLNHAILWCNTKIACALYARGADLTIRNQYRRAAPQQAALTDRSLCISAFLAGGMSANLTDSASNSLLHFAARDTDHEPVTKDLLAHGALPNVLNDAGVAPMHVAAQKNHTRVVGELLKGGADIDVRDSQGQTPLMAAITRGHTHVIEFLVRRGASLDVTDDAGWSALHFAAAKGKKKVLDTLQKPAKKAQRAKSTTERTFLKLVVPAELTPAEVAKFCGKSKAGPWL